MQTKKQYLPANIKAGFNVKDCKKMLSDTFPEYSAPFFIDITSYDHGRDVNGNGTAHYTCQIIATHKQTGKQLYFCTIVNSGKRREQVGYSGKNEAALYALDKLGFSVDTSKGGSYDYQGEAIYQLADFTL